MTRKVRTPFAERLRAGLEEALAHAKGGLTLKTIDHPVNVLDITGSLAAF
jgi:hypothetical protein